MAQQARDPRSCARTRIVQSRLQQKQFRSAAYRPANCVRRRLGRGAGQSGGDQPRAAAEPEGYRQIIDRYVAAQERTARLVQTSVDDLKAAGDGQMEATRALLSPPTWTPARPRPPTRSRR